MATQVIKLKRSATPGKVPTTSDLALGEVAINTYDGKAYIKKNDGSDSIVELGSGGSFTAPEALALYNKDGGGTTDAFDGVETRFQLRNSAGSIPTIISALHLSISVNGVIQQPNEGTPGSFDGFYITENTVAGTDIVFSTAPASGDSFFGVLGGQFTSISGSSAITRLDDISSSFDGIETEFTLTKNSSAYAPQYSVGVLVVLGGVVQIPTDSYSISGSTITFTQAPPTGTSFHAIDLKIGAPLTEELVLSDKNIELNAVASPSDANADGGGLTLRATTNKTLNWVDSTDSWTSSENVDLASGKTYKIAGTDVLSATALGSGVTGSSLTSVGNLTDLTVDTDTLVVDATNDRVGVNTSTPANTLDVTSTNSTISSTSTGNSTGKIALNADRAASTVNGQILGQWNGNTVARIDFINGADDVNKDDGSISFLTSNNSSNPLPRMTIAQSGDVAIDTDTLYVDATNNRVGVGTTSASAKLDVTNGGLCLKDTSSSFAATESISYFHDTSTQYAEIQFTPRNAAEGRIYVKNRVSSALADVVTIEGSNVGIGTVSPDAKFEVVENSTGSVEVARFRIEGQTNNPMLRIFADEANQTVTFGTSGSVAGTELVFIHGSSETARIDSSGRLLVGTSSTTADASQILEGNSASDTGSGNLLLARGQDTPADGIGLGQLSFTDNTHTPSGQIIGRRDGGTWSATSKPTGLDFRTTPDGSDSTSRRMIIGANGNITVGNGGALANTNVYLVQDVTGGGAASAYGFRTNQEIQPDVTSTFRAFSTAADTAANGGTAYTLSNLRHFEAIQGTFHADSTVSSQIAFRANANLNDATNNFGFVSDIDDEAGHGNFNFYASGTADNYFAGSVGIGTTSPDELLHLSAATAPTIRFEDTSTSGAVNDIIGAIEFEGNDASTNANGIRAKIEAETRGVGGQTDLVVYAAKESTATAYEALRVGSTAITFRTNDSEAAKIDSDGNVGIGDSAPLGQLSIRNVSGTGGFYLTRATSTSFGDVVSCRILTTSTAPRIYGYGTGLTFWTAAVSGTAAQRMTIRDGGNVGIGTGSPAYELDVNGSIRAQTQGRFAGASAGAPSYSFNADADTGMYRYGTNQIGFSTAGTARVVITSTGKIRPDTDDGQDLGSSTWRWRDIYAGNATIQTSDANLKQDVENLEQAELNVATAIKGLIKKYRFTKAVEEKGDDARIHVGVIAQEVEQAFVDQGLDPTRYALFCKDSWYAVDGKTVDDNGENYTEDAPGAVLVERFGIRYSELLAFVIAAL